jgi:hypothetical protein
MAFLTQNKAKLWKSLIITLVFEKNAVFSAENWRKSQKIVIITSTPGHPSCIETLTKTASAQGLESHSHFFCAMWLVSDNMILQILRQLACFRQYDIVDSAPCGSFQTIWYCGFCAMRLVSDNMILQIWRHVAHFRQYDIFLCHVACFRLYDIVEQGYLDVCCVDKCSYVLFFFFFFFFYGSPWGVVRPPNVGPLLWIPSCSYVHVQPRNKDKPFSYYYYSFSSITFSTSSPYQRPILHRLGFASSGTEYLTLSIL